MIEDVETLIEEERKSKPESSRGERQMTWDDYYSFDQISLWLDEVAASSDFAETAVIGTSYEGRDMKIIKICKGGCGHKPAVWLDGGIHAREWISPAVTTY